MSKTMFAVFNADRSEGVVFDEREDAEFAATGQQPNSFGVSTLASEWRDIYAEDDEQFSVEPMPMSEAADDIARLRAVINDAPHTELCRWSREWRNWQRGPQNKHDAPSDPLLCDCWKRAALRGDE